MERNIFLKDLLAFESGIDPEKFDWYIENLDKPFINYPTIVSPGRLLRCYETGKPIYKNITVREYFTILGVADKFVQDDPSCVFDMQHSVINPWGFVGYQIGEAILISNNYYEPKIIKGCPSYYINIDEHMWSANVRELEVVGLDYCDKILVSDTNRWQGKFTGKDGVNSFEDLLDPSKQTKIIVNIIQNNYEAIKVALTKKNLNLKDALKPEWTVSGIIAGAHFCGVSKLAEVLVDNIDAKDEMNTSAYSYILKFSGYDIDALIET